MTERARKAAERLRREVAEHAAGPHCGDPECLLHRTTHEAQQPHANCMIGRGNTQPPVNGAPQ